MILRSTFFFLYKEMMEELDDPTQTILSLSLIATNMSAALGILFIVNLRICK